MKFSVILTTFNRVETLPRAIKDVLAQEGVDFELVIVDDGSTDDTRSYLDSISDSRVVVVHRENGGPSAARNSGIAVASGDWIVILDDDDHPLPGWLLEFARLTDERAGVVCCSAEFYTREGEFDVFVPPWPLGPMFDHQVANTLAGAYAVRAEVIRLIGGFDERMTSSEQTEMWMRLIPELRSRGMSISTSEAVRIHLEWRAKRDRPMSSPAALLQATDVLIEKHNDAYSGDAKSRADLYGVRGVAAARLGQWSDARSALFTSVRAQPTDVRRWVRLVAASLPPVGRRLWKSGDYQPKASA